MVNREAQCLCTEGFTGTSGQGCTDINECVGNPCPGGAVCSNIPGSYSCQCPGGSLGDPYKGGCAKADLTFSCNEQNPCPTGENCVTDSYTGNSVCICRQGYVRDQDADQCRDVDECMENKDKIPCGLNALCKNLPGSYECQCPPGFNGNPYSLCEECNSLECQCQPPYKLVGGNCILAGCLEGGKCPTGAECISIAGGVSYCACPKGFRTQKDGTCIDVDECAEKQQICGYGADCLNNAGGYECICPPGYSGDAYHGICAPAQRRCAADRECSANEKCVQPGECVCPPPFFMDASDNNKCKSPCERFPCGINAKCTPSDPPQCMCEVGYKGDPLQGCYPEDECAHSPCAYGAHCINEKSGYKCVCPQAMTGDAYKGGCILRDPATAKSECTIDDHCSSTLKCIDGTCISPCSTLLCGPNAYCEPENHNGWCRCRVGFKKDKVSDQCVSQCENYACAQGAICIVTNEGPTCKCPPGELGNPFPGGSCLTDQCSAVRPCSEPQTCINGRCKHRCDGIVCGVGANCDGASGKCICEPYFVGNPDLLCMPPITGPACDPLCGTNAHCEYGLITNSCVCNSGTSGNPYEGCGTQKKISCSTIQCAPGAECREGLNSVECVCPSGYVGNPYVQCHDVDECYNDACGEGAVCINTPGSYDCKCKPNFAGNPFVMCSQIQKNLCDNPQNCRCSASVNCPNGFACKNGKCQDLCDRVACGPRAACDSGHCVCPPGFSGDPADLTKGCQSPGQCTNDGDCENSEICLQYGKGSRKCVDACSKLQCGPNALCVSNDHRSNCICADGYNGNPSDLYAGCQPEQRVVKQGTCETNGDCKPGFVCAMDNSGTKSCVDPCYTVVCGSHESCKIDKAGNPVCNCKDSFVWNPVSSSCEKPSIPDCTRDDECHHIASCTPDVLGVLKCAPVCAEYTCPANSICVAADHRGSCQCLPSYTGNPNDRNGCRAELQNQCSSSAECPESEHCITHGLTGILMCRPACENIKCGPHAVCITNNHAAQCQCPPGPFAGDPYDLIAGCKSVPCVYNIDCPPTQLCNRLTHTCYNVCDDESCGDNAVCIAEDHRAICQCPPGFRGNPIADVECISTESCNPNPCHETALCEASAGGHICKCPPNYVGDPFSAGCRPEGYCPNGNSDCPENSACLGGKCVDPCENACGQNSVCNVVNRKPVCSCQLKFAPALKDARDGCVRIATGCSNDIDCGGDVCYNGMCKVACRNSNDCSSGEKCTQNICALPCSGHSLCPSSQACVAGSCILGCRSNKDCSSDSACVNNKCQNPCASDGACGPNALCNCVDHIPSCKCPAGFEGNPVPEQGCVRVPATCSATNQCPQGHMCIANQCNLPCASTTSCAVGERCYNNVCTKVCYTNNNCLPGEICNDAGTCQPGCASDGDCPYSQVCINAKCKCGTGFIGTPFGCSDIDECTENPCHPSARCENGPGSFRCACPETTVGDAYSEPGCRLPNQCYKNEECANNLACVEGKCKDPCSVTQCGPNAQCHSNDHRAVCECPPGNLGDARDTTVGCFKVECISDDDCSLEKHCDSEVNKCINPCDYINCGKGTCQIHEHEGICSCFQGYTLLNGKCEDINECEHSPCHRSAVCQNTPGNFVCSCPEGLVGDPISAGCRNPGECFTDSDCPNTAACEDSRCRNPCEAPNVCGENALCTAVAHSAVCNCPLQTKGDAHIACIRVECSDNDDCPASKSCIDAKCVDPCTLSNVCGRNADCVADNHLGVCSCQPGTTGNPLLGCISIQYCSSDRQCPAGTKCNNGLCCSVCTSNRDCFGDQLCIQNICQPTCRSNTTCPDFQFCLNNICTQEVRCKSDDDCDIDENCVIDSEGKSECTNACQGRVLCGRNAQCTARQHNADCACKEGFYGDAKTGCKKIECNSDNDCSNDKTCDAHMCKIVCLLGEGCGQNALCSAENHKQVCYCQPGYTGNPKEQCTAIDYCHDAPCGPGARCKNSRGSFKCSCPQGSVGDPNVEGCRAAVECETNQDCPTAAECSTLNGVPKCKSVCENTLCGPNAECQPKGHVAYCVCRGGFDGDANDLSQGCRPLPVPCHTTLDCPANTYCYSEICKPACALDVECGFDERCSNGQCINPCEQPQACGMNAECLINSHYKQCSCPPGFTGNADVECVRSKFFLFFDSIFNFFNFLLFFLVPVACASNTDCTEGYSCRDTMCLPSCTSDQDCALNEQCLNSNCMLTCRVDNDCFLGHICLNNKCVFGCHSDEDCSASESCRGNQCLDPCMDSPCGPNTICTVSNHRASCSCLQGMVASPTAKIGCVRTPAISCTENRGCPSDFACFGEMCRPVCANDAGCLNNERCEAGACKPLCRRDDDCRNGEVCQGLICVSGCRSDSGCPGSLSCINQQCIDPCLSPTACGTNAECACVNHKKQCSCPAPLVGDASVGCRFVPTVCDSHNDCPTGHSCYGNVCQATCRK